MPSPFPGFDPFLEGTAFWPYFHATFINYWREAIADALPPNYEAGLGEHSYLAEAEPDARKIVVANVADSSAGLTIQDPRHRSFMSKKLAG